MFEVDFSGTGSKSLDPGNYVGIVTGTEKYTSKESDKVSFAFKVNIDGKTYFTRRYFLGGKDNNFFLKQAYSRLGIELPKTKVDLDTIETFGIKAEFAVAEREYNGKKYSDMEPIKPIGKADDKELLKLEGAPF